VLSGAFLDHNACWKGATRFYHADTLTSSWRKRKNLPHQKAAVDNASIQKLAGFIRNYFHHTDGRGNHCVVEPLRRGELDYFFAYPEDYSQQSIEWVDGEFAPRPHNPAFEIIFVYSEKDGTLDLHFRGSYKAIEPLQGMFATAILNLDELPPDPKDARVYDLAPLLQKSFDFAPAVGSGIEKVVVKKLRLSSRVKKGDRITLEADTTANPDAVYALLEQVGNLSRKVVSIADIWDLPMIGSERLDVEHLYQQLTGGPEVTLTGMDGAFVEREDGVVAVADIYLLKIKGGSLAINSSRLFMQCEGYRLGYFHREIKSNLVYGRSLA